MIKILVMVFALSITIMLFILAIVILVSENWLMGLLCLSPFIISVANRMLAKIIN